MDNLVYQPIEQLMSLLAKDELTAVDLTRSYLSRIDRLNGDLNAYVDVFTEQALAQAACSDQRRKAGITLGPLDGIPIAVKNLCGIAGKPLGAGSRTLEHQRAQTTATAIHRLIAGGAVILGSTHMVEYAFGAWGTNQRLGTPKNPWDQAVHRVAGGSSSGSGVAVAAGLAAAAIGSDTGGSIRTPSLLNGITGLKMTSGRISLSGCVDLSHTLDTLGPMTRSAWDAALLANTMAGYDHTDPRTYGGPQAPVSVLGSRSTMDELRFDAKRPLEGVVLARMPKECYPVTLKTPFAEALETAASVMRNLGATVIEREFPFDFREMMTLVGRIIATEGYAIYHREVANPSAALDEKVRQRLKEGGDVTASEYIAALKAHEAAKRAWKHWMTDIDAVLVPGAPITATALSEVDEASTDLSVFARPANFLGACALALPAGFDANLPLGVQLYGKPFGEAALLRIGHAWQQTTDWHLQHPPL